MKMDRFKIVHKSDLQLFNKKRNTVFQLSRRQEVSWMGLEDMGETSTMYCAVRHKFESKMA